MEQDHLEEQFKDNTIKVELDGDKLTFKVE